MRTAPSKGIPATSLAEVKAIAEEAYVYGFQRLGTHRLYWFV